MTFDPYQCYAIWVAVKIYNPKTQPGFMIVCLFPISSFLTWPFDAICIHLPEGTHGDPWGGAIVAETHRSEFATAVAARTAPEAIRRRLRQGHFEQPRQRFEGWMCRTQKLNPKSDV